MCIVCAIVQCSQRAEEDVRSLRTGFRVVSDLGIKLGSSARALCALLAQILYFSKRGWAEHSTCVLS